MTFFAKNGAAKSHTFTSVTEWQDSGEHGCWLKVSSPACMLPIFAASVEDASNITVIILSLLARKASTSVPASFAFAQQVRACITTRRKPLRRWSKKKHVANLCQSTMLFGIVWVLLSQAFATWRGWGADSAATLLAGCFFLCLRWQWIVLSRLGVALLSFVLVS